MYLNTRFLDYRHVVDIKVVNMSATVDYLHCGLLSRLYGKLLVLFEAVLQEVSVCVIRESSVRGSFESIELICELLSCFVCLNMFKAENY